MDKTIGVGMIGYAFMGRAHSNGWRQAPRFFNLPLMPVMKTICGRNKEAVTAAAKQMGWQKAETDWKKVISDPEIKIVDICTPRGRKD